MLRPLLVDRVTLSRFSIITAANLRPVKSLHTRNSVRLNMEPSSEASETESSSKLKTPRCCSPILQERVLPASSGYVDRAVAALKQGQVIAVPTDTLYGLAADACSHSAVQNIYEIKGRNNKNPLAVCLAQARDFDRYSITSHLPEGLLNDLFPGPVTAVLQRGEHSLLDESLNPGISSIGIRVPDCTFIRQVVETFGGAIALTSANVSGQASTVRVQEFESLWPYCAFIFDAGEIASSRAGSTVVDLTNPGTFKILRDGSALEATLATLSKYGLTEAKLE